MFLQLPKRHRIVNKSETEARRGRKSGRAIASKPEIKLGCMALIVRKQEVLTAAVPPKLEAEAG